MGYLALLFIVVPAVEMTLLVELGSRIGGVGTLALVITTGVVGASLAKRAGLDVLRRIQTETQQGHVPTDALLDGAIILVAGVLLVTPGILTDLVGFACLIPGLRGVMKGAVRSYLARAAAKVEVVTPSPAPWPQEPFVANWPPKTGQGPVIDVTPEPPPSDRQV